MPVDTGQLDSVCEMNGELPDRINADFFFLANDRVNRSDSWASECGKGKSFPIDFQWICFWYCLCYDI